MSSARVNGLDRRGTVSRVRFVLGPRSRISQTVIVEISERRRCHSSVVNEAH